MTEINITCKGSKYMPLDQLKNFQGNLKTLPVSELDKLKGSIMKHGFSFPVFVWNDSILDGHQRTFAVKKLMDEGYTIGNIPVVEIEAGSRTEAAEKLLILNSHYAHITEDGLSEFLSANELDINEIVSDLNLPDFDMESFLSGTIDEPVETEGLTDDDEVPDLPEEADTKPGDLIYLGPHRLLCGDSTSETDVKRLMGNNKSDMCFTSPPYNVGRTPNGKNGTVNESK
ncbi:MAG: ParB N-terminal domain-containing protein, partial [Proteobacteria bacterium]|nr:ParB N-terminal domain-containing protein [Pseudomonadota bacterium]